MRRHGHVETIGRRDGVGTIRNTDAAAAGQVVEVVEIVARERDDLVPAGVRHRTRKPVDVVDRRFARCRTDDLSRFGEPRPQHVFVAGRIHVARPRSRSRTTTDKADDGRCVLKEAESCE